MRHDDNNSAYGLLTVMGGKLDRDLTAVNERLTSIEKKLDMLLVRSQSPTPSTFDYVVEVAMPPSSGPTLTGNLLDEDEKTPCENE